MKAICLIIFGLMISSATIAQSVEELDKKGGFKEFKVGDSISVYKDKGKFTKSGENADTKMFLVKELVSVKKYTGEIELKVYKSKVQEVIVSFKNSTKADFDDLLKSLETLYGQSTVNKKKSPELDRFEKVNVWTGEKIVLRLGYDANRKLTEMKFVDQHNTLDKLKEEF
jgi:hypothetical protein